MSNAEEVNRVKFASELISEMAKAGLSSNEISVTLTTYADMLDHLKEAGYSYDKVAAAFEAQDAEAISEISDKLSMFGLDGAAQGMTNLAGKVVDGLTAMGTTGMKYTALGGALAGVGIPVAAYLGGKGIGAAAGHATERDEDYINEVKHDELLSMLRENAATLRRRKATRDLNEGY